MQYVSNGDIYNNPDSFDRTIVAPFVGAMYHRTLGWSPICLIDVTRATAIAEATEPEGNHDHRRHRAETAIVQPRRIDPGQRELSDDRMERTLSSTHTDVDSGRQRHRIGSPSRDRSVSSPRCRPR